MTRRLTKHAKERIRVLYGEKALGVQQIADLYGIHRRTVYDTCKDLVLTHPTKVTGELAIEMQRLRDGGLSIAQTARKLGVDPSTVKRHTHAS